jgi:hypothetical protein
MKNIHLIPTDKPSRLYKFEDKLIKNDLIGLYDYKEKGYIAQHIYITNTEKPKEGDWYLYKDKENYEHVFKWAVGFEDNTAKYGKKVILTDNNDLIADGVQEISEDFLQWFVQNSDCEEVEFANSLVRTSSFDWRTDYKIIIPQEEPKQFIDCKCTNALEAENCTRNCGYGEEPKQETLEEAKQEQKQHLIDLMRLDEQGTLEEVSPMNDLLIDLRETKISVKESIDIIEDEFMRTQINIFVQKTLDSVIDRIENELLETEFRWRQEQDKNKYSDEDILDAWELGAKEGLPLTRKKKEKLFKQFKKSKNESNT